jgi:hypothetical protein
VNSRKRRPKTAGGAAKLRKAAINELTKRGGSIVKSLLDSSASEEFNRVRLMYDMAGDSAEVDDGLRKRRSIALELAAEPPWQPESAERDMETAAGTSEAKDEQQS